LERPKTSGQQHHEGVNDSANPETPKTISQQHSEGLNELTNLETPKTAGSNTMQVLTPPEMPKSNWQQCHGVPNTSTNGKTP